MQKTAGALSEAVPLPSRRRTGGERLEPATQPHHEQAMPRNRAKRDAKTAGAPSEAVPLSSRRRTGGEWLEPVTLPYPQQAMPPHTPLKHPAMYTYPTKFMHNLCHIVM